MTQISRATNTLKRFRKKFVKEPMQRFKKKAKWYWPELHLYCGICDLKTGLYIRSIISVLMYFVVVFINVLMLYHLLSTGAKLANMQLSDIEEYLGISFSDVSMSKVKLVYTVLISYIIFWIVFKFVFIASAFLTIYAVYKKKPKTIKIVFYIGAFNWLVDLCISVFGTVLLQGVSRVIAIVGILFEGYNLLALRSEYKQMRGKSKLLINLNADVGLETVASSSSSETIHSEDDVSRVSENPRHCESCTCFTESISSIHNTIAGTVMDKSTSDSTQTPDLEPEAEKIPNIKDVDTIFNQNMLVTGQSQVLEMPVTCVNDTLIYRMDNQRAVRPRTLHLHAFSEEKIDIVDTPTIYDENQLNVGRSPVVEDNPNCLPSSESNDTNHLPSPESR